MLALEVAVAALWILFLVLTVLVVLLYRHFGLIALGTLEGVQRDGLSVGEPAPSVVGVTATGQDAEWAPQQGHWSLLLFATPECGPCAAVMPYLSDLARVRPDLEIVAVTDGPQRRAEELVTRYDPPFVCLAEDASGAFEKYRVRVTPFAFLIGTDRRVYAKGLCSGPEALAELLRRGGLGDDAGAVEAAAARFGSDSAPAGSEART